MDQDLPIRVIRGHKCAGSYTHKIYTYDGLYKVEHTYEFNVCLLSKNYISFEVHEIDLYELRIFLNCMLVFGFMPCYFLRYFVHIFCSTN